MPKYNICIATAAIYKGTSQHPRDNARESNCLESSANLERLLPSEQSSLCKPLTNIVCKRQVQVGKNMPEIVYLYRQIRNTKAYLSI